MHLILYNHFKRFYAPNTILKTKIWGFICPWQDTGRGWAATTKGTEVSTSRLGIYERGAQSAVLPKNSWPQSLCFEDIHRKRDPSELSGKCGLWLGFHSFYNHGLWLVIPCERLIPKEAFLDLQTRKRRLREVKSPCQSHTAGR